MGNITESVQRAGLHIHIIGLGVAETAELGRPALAALTNADRVIGSPRQLEVVAALLTPQQTEPLPPLSALSERIASLAQQGVTSLAVLASGDPLYYGIGRWFGRHFDAEQLHFYPAVSSIQAACHQLGLALQDVDVLSLHGRPLEKIRSKLRANQTLLVLTDQYSQPQVLARECIAAGFEQSRLSVCESLGYRQQKISQYSAAELVDRPAEFDPLHVTVIETRGPGGVLPEFPGIEDSRYITGREAGKGMLTKREVRLAILSLLQPANEDVIWDIGAGCGGVAVELAYWNERTRVHAIEHHQQRFECLMANRDKFGVLSNLLPVQGRAPAILSALPAPNKVFIGGSDGSLPELLTRVWALLPDRGVLVASAVTENTRQHLLAFLAERQRITDGSRETLQIAVSHGGALAGQLLYRPNLPVSLFKFIKTEISQ